MNPNAHKGGITKGPSHANGGIPTLNVSTGQLLEVEGNEMIVNKNAATDPTVIRVEGTPKQVVSCVNEKTGGVSFTGGQPCNMEVINAPQQVPVACNGMVTPVPGQAPVAAAGGMLTDDNSPFNILFWPFKI